MVEAPTLMFNVEADPLRERFARTTWWRTQSCETGKSIENTRFLVNERDCGFDFSAERSLSKPVIPRFRDALTKAWMWATSSG
jgi:hypothetical protein